MASWQQYTEYKQSLSPLMRTLLQTGELVVVVVVVLTLFSAFTGTSSATLNLQDDGISISASDDLTVEVAYADIQSITLEELPDSFGTCVDGSEGRNYSYGVWQSDTWGDYILAAKTSLTQVIVIETEEQTVVFNYESDDVTAQLYEHFLEEATE
ncbi:MAG: hypothetical protein LIO78_08895 [Clostridiales bacterium]|nr:hypothetical protein [Clostridiales bacterium]